MLVLVAPAELLTGDITVAASSPRTSVGGLVRLRAQRIVVARRDLRRHGPRPPGRSPHRADGVRVPPLPPPADAAAETYERLDQLLRDTFGDERFVTAEFATLDADDGTLEILNVGHPGTLVVRDGHVIDLRDEQAAMPLGLGNLRRSEASVPTRTVALEPGIARPSTPTASPSASTR